MQEKIAVIGLGYVGLPLLIGLGRHFDGALGFDIDTRRVNALQSGKDWTEEVAPDQLKSTRAKITSDPKDLSDCTFFIVTVPTPIDQTKRPDLTPLLGACKTIGDILRGRKNTNGPVPLVIFESTVYPGLTEEVCGTTIAEISGLTVGKDFALGYSPERINPGDKQNRLETIVKVISAQNAECVDRMEAVYGKVIEAKLYKASSIRVAEAAKVLENTQRDLNIALMNELAIICDRIGIRTHDVLETAGTKWNFLKFTPGLVGGHCIGIDPYYLTTRAEELGYHPQVILAGRRINDNMGVFLGQKVVKLLVDGGSLRPGARVGVLGLAFKENVRDLRNSRVPEVVREMKSFGIDVLVHDPLADAEHAQHEYGLKLHKREELTNLDALVIAVPHAMLMNDLSGFYAAIRPNGWVVDVKSAIVPASLPKNLQYWSL